jgi:hypothetical protein
MLCGNIAERERESEREREREREGGRIGFRLAYSLLLSKENIKPPKKRTWDEQSEMINVKEKVGFD